MVADVTAVGSLDRAKCAILGVILAGRVLVNPDHFCGRGATMWCRTPLLSSNYNFTQGRLMKLEWLVTDVTAIVSPDRAEPAILGVVLARCVFDQFRPYLHSYVEPFCDVGTTS